MFAVVSVGGRQFKVRPGTLIRAPRMKEPLQERVSLPVLAVGGLNGGGGDPAGSGAQTSGADKAAAAPAPTNEAKAGEGAQTNGGTDKTALFAASQDGLKEAQATALTLNHGRGKKILVFKKKRRKGYRRTKGFREAYTDLLVIEIKLPSGEILKAPARKLSSPAKKGLPPPQAQSASESDSPPKPPAAGEGGGGKPVSGPPSHSKPSAEAGGTKAPANATTVEGGKGLKKEAPAKDAKKPGGGSESESVETSVLARSSAVSGEGALNAKSAEKSGGQPSSSAQNKE